tara:strand:- start:306 stop:1226 length:921 start_codon:yes stop_codon:yes gene_type:complete
MATIQKVSGIDFANISNFDGVDTSTIGSIISIDKPATGGSLLLDTYTGAAAGHSLRRLSSTYTGSAIKVQDNVGGSTLDVGFDSNGELDTSAIAAYGGSNDVFVETWYDQSGNGDNAVQATSANRPKIYDGATGAVTLENGKPAISFDGTNDYFLISYPNLDQGDITISTVCATNNISSAAMQFVLGGTNTNRIWHYSPGANNDRFYYGSRSPIVYTTNDTNQNLFSVTAGTTSNGFRVFKNTVEFPISLALTTGSLDTTQMRIGAYINNGITWEGTMQEFIVYPIDETNNLTGIETNINDFYVIY